MVSGERQGLGGGSLSSGHAQFPSLSKVSARAIPRGACDSSLEKHKGTIRVLVSWGRGQGSGYYVYVQICTHTPEVVPSSPGSLFRASSAGYGAMGFKSCSPGAGVVAVGVRAFALHAG